MLMLTHWHFRHQLRFHLWKHLIRWLSLLFHPFYHWLHHRWLASGSYALRKSEIGQLDRFNGHSLIIVHASAYHCVPFLRLRLRLR